MSRFFYLSSIAIIRSIQAFCSSSNVIKRSADSMMSFMVIL
nr:MAG TPA: hypothetical protein [Caudoviricetes sp.]